jgi:hypothetical protein
MQGEPVDASSQPDDPNEAVSALWRQMKRLKRCFEWERWLLEPRSFAPPEETDSEDAGDT